MTDGADEGGSDGWKVVLRRQSRRSFLRSALVLLPAACAGIVLSWWAPGLGWLWMLLFLVALAVAVVVEVRGTPEQRASQVDTGSRPSASTARLATYRNVPPPFVWVVIAGVVLVVFAWLGLRSWSDDPAGSLVVLLLGVASAATVLAQARVRVDRYAEGVDVVRAIGRRWLPWDSVETFDLATAPGGAGAAIAVLADGTVEYLGIGPGSTWSAGRAARAQRTVDELNEHLIGFRRGGFSR